MSAIRIFLVEDGEVRRIPLTVFERLHDGKERMPQCAGRKVKYVLVSLETVERRPVSVFYAEFGVLEFDRWGRLDPAAQSEAMRLAAESLSFLEVREGPGTVIRAEGRFARKQYSDRFHWRPSEDQLEAIGRALWGG